MHNLYQILANTDWSFIDNTILNIDEKFSHFVYIIHNHIRQVFTEKLLSPKKRDDMNTSRWFTPKLREMRNFLCLINDMHMRFPNLVSKQTVNNYRSNYRSNIKSTKNEYISNYIKSSNNKAKACWTVVNSFRNINKYSNCSNKITAEVFNEFFVNISSEIVDNLPLSNLSHTDFLVDYNSLEEFHFHEVSQSQIRNVVNMLKNKNSRDVYDMNVYILKRILDVIISPLTRLINKAINANIFPSVLKVAKVVPIPKCDSADEPNKYRPISILPVFSKVFETILKNQMCMFFEQHNLFNQNQFGFRTGKSTTAAINHLIELVIQGFEIGSHTASIFYDLQKAFDCVSCDILVNKFTYYRLNQNSIDLLKSYLNNRLQCTCIHGSSSSFKNVLRGVPQGSVLGPLLFLIFINDMGNSIPGIELTLFADDTTATINGDDVSTLLNNMNNITQGVQDWLLANKLKQNVSKTQTIIFTNRQLNGFDNEKSIKFLGVHLDPTLTWNVHVDYISNKIAKNIYVLRRLYGQVDLDLLLSTYHSLIASIMNYALICWGHSSHANRIFKLQRKAIRVITGSGYREDVKDKFVDLKILTLPSLYIYNCLLYVKQNINQFTPQNEIHTYPTRANNLIRIGYLRLAASRNGINYYGPMFFNYLPLHVARLPLKNFKLVVKQFLINAPFYSISDFFDCDMSTF